MKIRNWLIAALSAAIALTASAQYYDKETGLNYNGMRDYDPSTGRYIESDPLGLGGGQWSTYTYVNGNPLIYTDPKGELAQVVAPAVILTTGAYLICKADPGCNKGMNNVWGSVYDQAAQAAQAASNAAHSAGQACSNGAKKAWNGIFSSEGEAQPSDNSQRCDGVRKTCQSECSQRYANGDPGFTPGPQAPSDMRKCIRTCMAAQGCHDY